MAGTCSKAMISDFKEAFDIFDEDKDGVIPIDVLTSVLQKLAPFFSTLEIDMVSKAGSAKRKSTISFDQFLELFSKFSDEANREEFDGLYTSFCVVDVDGDGFISKEDLRNFHAMIGDSLSDETLDKMIIEADIDGDHRIDFNEFVINLKNLESIR